VLVCTTASNWLTRTDDKDTNDTDGTTTDWQDSADYDIGDAVPFQLKGTVASNYASYTTYKFAFHDKESAGLTFNEKSVKVYVDGTEMEVIAVKDSEGNIRTAFNTCQICYDSGNGYYKQEGDKLVCQNCGNSFTMDQVGQTAGGCNPYPIMDDDKTVTEDEIQISYDFLKESSDIFTNWKR